MSESFVSNILMSDYNYDLPDDKIAKYPLPKRDDSKLLIYNQGQIHQSRFYNIIDYFDNNSLLIFNNTKVIPARLIFHKDSGAEIEILCIDPVYPYTDFNLIFQQKARCKWNCIIGNLKKWKSGKLSRVFEHNGHMITLTAEKYELSDVGAIVKFSWIPEDLMFSEVLDLAGMVPLPPYIDRKPENIDLDSYQTIYAQHKGSAAAPTAGLHFTENVIQKLKVKGIKTENVTLHINTGTFKPVSALDIAQHKMHKEFFSVRKELIENILNHKNKLIISVGTTTTRTLESLYWLGVKLIIGHYELRTTNYELNIDQWDAYMKKYNTGIDTSESLSAVLEYMKANHMETLTGNTSIIIVPGYKFRIVNQLITNFHQPKSTLLLLIAAFIGDNWKMVYEYALQNDFRFLSYGDSCLLTRVYY